MLPNGFSYPTTITMCFFRAGYSVVYEPIVAPERIGKSHIRLGRDGIRFFLIIFNDWHAVFSAQAFSANQPVFFHDRLFVLSLYVSFLRSIYEHERLVADNCRTGFSNRLDFRTYINPQLQGQQ